MRGPLRLAYEGLASVASALSAVAPSGRGKLTETFAARRNLLAQYQAFERDAKRPLAWLHAPSVGEGLQARPVIDLLSVRAPHVQRAYTWFSPSATAFGKSLDVDFAAMLPFDTSSNARSALEALQPTALVFSKLDVWPTLVREAAQRGTQLGIISATLSEKSSRRSGIASALLRDAYARIARVGAISQDDADRLVSLGVPASRVSVTGDTRYDQVYARALAADRGGAVLSPLVSARPTVVAGSTWPSDEHVLLEAWTRVRSLHRDARLIIAPHEPTESHVGPIQSWARSTGARAALVSAATASDDIVIVDRTGILGDLYALADIAFVGGAFHGAGIHSVLEPAAFGAPVIFGPRYQDSRDARRLIGDDAAVAVSTAEEMANALNRWLGDATDRAESGAAALRAVQSGLGAAERSFALVMELMGALPDQR